MSLSPAHIVAPHRPIRLHSIVYDSDHCKPVIKVNTMKVCIFGSGGVGGYFGARLAQSGMDVTFISRGKHREQMLEKGLKVSSICGDCMLENVHAIENPANAAPYDLALVGVKAWQVTDAAKQLKGALSPDGVAIPLQNGIEAPDRLAAVLGEDHALAGLCGLVSFLEAPGHIQHVGIDPFIRIGEKDGTRSKRVEELAAQLDQADGMTVTAPEDIRVALWLKFIFIVGMSGIGSITRAPIGVSREYPETRKILEACITEAYDVGCAKGVSLPPDAVERTLKNISNSPPAVTASMQRDIIDGKPSELFDQNQAVSRFGKQEGVATPINDFISAALQPLEDRARGKVEF